MCTVRNLTGRKNLRQPAKEKTGAECDVIASAPVLYPTSNPGGNI